jgi:hypothetical protein
MRDDELDEVAANIDVLIRAELETQHQLDGHPTRVAECPACRGRRLAGRGATAASPVVDLPDRT